jgi:membrane protein
MQFVERSIALGSLAFTALVPLLVIASAFLPATSGLADELISRFDLHGSTEQLVREVFAQPDAVRQSVSWLGVLLLIGAALSFTRALQRVYEHAWRLETRGLAGTRAGLTWLLGVVLWATAFSAVRGWLLDLTGPIGRAATHDGPIGIAIALVSWLVGAGFALTVCAAVGAVLGGAVDEPRTRLSDG